MTMLHQPASVDDRTTEFNVQFENLTEFEKRVIKELEEDVDSARSLCKPRVFGLVPGVVPVKHGQVNIVITQSGGICPAKLKKDEGNHVVSNLEIGGNTQINLELISKLLGILKLKGHQNGGLDFTPECMRTDTDGYFTYQIRVE